MKPTEAIQKLEQMLEETELSDDNPDSILHTAREDVEAMLAHLRAKRGKPRKKGNIVVAKRIGENLGHQAHTNPFYQQDPRAKYLAISAASYARQLKF